MGMKVNVFGYCGACGCVFCIRGLAAKIYIARKMAKATKIAERQYNIRYDEREVTKLPQLELTAY